MAEARFYGGQAVIEGVMMRGQEVYATAVRRRDGSIVVERRPVPRFLEGWRFSKLPLVRGTFALIETLMLGIRSLQFSGNIALMDELAAEPAPLQQDSAPTTAKRPWAWAGLLLLVGASVIVWGAPRLAPTFQARVPFLGSIELATLALRVGLAVVIALFLLRLLGPQPGTKPARDKLDDSTIWMAMLPALAIGLGLFVLLPTWLAGLVGVQGGYGVAVLKNLLEGLIRLAVILGYIGAISFIGQVRRVFQYHGAEHQVINALETEGRVDEETALRQSPLHPRCGTAFLLLFIVLKIVIGSFFGWPTPGLRLVLRLAMVPVVAALAYEATRLAGRFRHVPVLTWLFAPGLLLQRLTTRRPEPAMVQVAIYALAAVAPEVSLPPGWPPPAEITPSHKASSA